MGTAPTLSSPRIDVGVRLGVLGGGFGLYGYLPAAVSLGWNVVTLKKYTQILISRQELAPLIDKVILVDTETDVLRSCDAVAIARDPQSQMRFLQRHSPTLSSMQHVFLEKPLADTIDHAKRCLDLLTSWQAPFSLGYLFPFTAWFDSLHRMTSHPGPTVSIEWRIPTTNSTWKSDPASGGGMSSFYLVHFVPVLQHLGIDVDACAIRVQEQSYLLHCEAPTMLHIQSKMVRSGYSFRVSAAAGRVPVYEGETPFGARPRPGAPDPRIVALRRYMSESISTKRHASSQGSSLQLEERIIRFRLACQAAGIP